MPLVRTFVPVVAGVAGMGYRQFAMFNICGGIGWVASMTLGGYFLGSVFPELGNHIEKVIIVDRGALRDADGVRVLQGPRPGQGHRRAARLNSARAAARGLLFRRSPRTIALRAAPPTLRFDIPRARGQMSEIAAWNRTECVGMACQAPMWKPSFGAVWVAVRNSHASEVCSRADTRGSPRAPTGPVPRGDRTRRGT